MGRRRNKTLIKADRIEHLDVARVHNPRYLVSRDGVEVGIFPGFNALMAINAARKIYGAGKYSSVKTGEAMYLGRGALETERREREAQAARAAAKAQAKRDKIQLPKGKGTRTRRTANAEFDGMPKSIEFGARHRRTIDFGRRKRGAERDLVMAYADHLLRSVLAQNWALDDPALYLELSSKAKTSAKRKHKIDPTRAALLLDQAEEIMQGERRNPGGDVLQQGVKSGLVPAGLVTDLQRLAAGRFPANPAQRKNLLTRAIKVRSDLVYQNLLAYDPLGEAVQRALQSIIEGEVQRVPGYSYNPAEKDAEHPIEVTRHFRGGPPGYLSPWQKAMAIGQAELFDTGIKLAPRAAELRAARLSNPGATKPVYQSGLKLATAAQLGRLARVGLRVGRTPTEIRSDLAATGRFTAEQIRRGLDQATTAEERRNPMRHTNSYSFEQAKQIYSTLNNAGVGFAIGNENQKLTAATRAEGWKVLQQFDISLLLATDSQGNKFLVGGDGLGLNAWAVKIPAGKRQNPPVREIYEKFNGRPATRQNSVDAPRGTPARVAQLGRLRLIRTRDGRSWKFPGDRAPFLAADSRGKLHVVGGAYRANPAGESCGEIEQIEYQTSKPHLGHENETIYYHQLGEETGVMPVLEITPEGHLKIVGGDYRIEADGIHN